ncbi:uncharacterized protein LOC134281205 [Saccostrea cucullata]|uniref:uncharacterized protein LOC134281205 n=1 Tax=Saccostrea cuccullata TaxID=36930 RepID=UPI002ED48B3A
MIIILLVFLLKTVTSEYLHYDCYGSGLMDANCSVTQQIYPVGVKVGTKEAMLNCSKEYTPDLNWTMTQFDQCCKPDPGDLCYGDYVNVGDPLNTFIFYDYCIGRSSCRILQVQRVDTLYLGCDQTLYYPQTTFMALEYDCIDESKILILNTIEDVSSDPGGSVYLQGHDYRVPGISSAITMSACSIEAPSCDSTITIEVLDLRLAADGSDCKQSITIIDGYRYTNLSCINNINFTRFTVASEYNYLNVTFYNSMTSSGGHFWFGFRGAHSDVIRIDCPAKPPVTDCNFTTTTTTSTSTTTELDTSTTESETTSTVSVTNSTQLFTGTVSNPAPPQDDTENKDIIYITVGIVLAVLMMLILIACHCFNKKRKGKINPQNNTQNEIQKSTDVEKSLYQEEYENRNQSEPEIDTCDMANESKHKEKKKKMKKNKKKLAKKNKEKKHSSENVDENENAPQNEVVDIGLSASTSTDIVNHTQHRKNKHKKKRQKEKHSKHEENSDIVYANFGENINMPQTDDLEANEYRPTSSVDVPDELTESKSRDVMKKKKRKKKNELNLDEETVEEERQRKVKKKKKKHRRELNETNDGHTITTNDIQK